MTKLVCYFDSFAENSFFESCRELVYYLSVHYLTAYKFAAPEANAAVERSEQHSNLNGGHTQFVQVVQHNLNYNLIAPTLKKNPENAKK